MAVIEADLVQALGYTGAGVKVAIIDIGFEGYATNPDLPSACIKEATSYRADHDFEYDDHGTACAEIVLDVAPQADLYLYNFETISELNSAVSRAITVGVDVISFSIGYTSINNFDGIGYSGIGDVCSIVNHARSHGILFVVSMGNYAEHHYEGTWADSNSNDFHEFSGFDEELDLGYLTTGTFYNFELTWDDWPYSDQDYELVLYDSSFYPIDISWDWQTGSQRPYDYIIGFIPYGDYYYLDIFRYDATQSVDFELYELGDTYLYEYVHPESSLICPADATGATSIGATYWQDDSLESYSSQGPTNDARTKPDVTAPAGVSTYTYGVENFYGSSASTPHVAGVAALILSVDSTLTPSQLQTVLESTSVDLGTMGKDNSYGSGRINASAAYNSPTVNKKPVANDDNYTTTEDITLIVSVPGLLTNDIDGDHDLLTASKVTNPSHGTLKSFSSNGSFTYVPTANYFDTDSFTYKVYDGTVYSNIATVHINVTSMNDAPVAGNIPNQTIAEGKTFTTINLDNYVSDADNTDAEITWTCSGNSSLTVSILARVATISIPNADWNGAETITFRATDPGSLWDDDPAMFNVTAVNDPPVISDIPNQTIAEGLTFSAINLDNYVSDIDNTDAQMTWTYSGNSQLTVSIVNRVATISIPNTDWYGAETITFRATDPSGNYSQDAAIFTVTSVNDPPIISNIPNQTIAEGSTFTTISLDNYVSDVDNTDSQMTWTYSGNSQLTVSIVNRVATISIPNADWYGVETITFNATDPGSLWNQDAAIFTITPVNDPPIANDDTTTVIEDSSNNQINVRANDTDIEGDTLIITSVTQPSHGSSSTNGNYVYYTPTTNYSGLDSFTYTVNDGNGGNDTAIVHITVIGVNDPPVASFNFEPINPTTQETVFFNSTSYDSEGFISNYTWDFGDGNISYQQKTIHLYAEYGAYLITLNVTDSDGVNATIQKTINISVNYPPNISDPSPSNDSTNVNENSNISWTGGDPNGDIVTYDVYFGNTSSPDKVKSNQSDTIYDPPRIMNLTTTYYWRIVAWDNHGANNASPTWRFTIRTNYPPTARPDSFSTNEDTTLSVTASSGLLENDNDSYDDPNILTAVKVSNTIHGSVTLNSNGSFSYVPTANYYGIDMFTYKVYDGYVYSTVVNVTITINPVNDPPVLGTPSPSNGSTGNQLSLTWSIPINDPEGDQFSWTIQCNNGQTNSSSGDETNGTKSLTISGLAYSKSYKVWVNATDQNGSGLNIQRWYTFTTKNSGGSGGGGGGYTPPVEEKANTPPVANANGPYYEFVGIPVIFDGSASKDIDGNITNYAWVFGDGTTGTGKTTTHTYYKVGNYTVTLTVTDNGGKIHADTTYAVITEKPNYPPTASFSYSPLNLTTDDVIQFTDLSTDTDGIIVSYYWNFSDGTNSTDKNPNHTYNISGTYLVSLIIKDNNNATDTISKAILVEETQNKDITGTETDKGTPGFELIIVIIGIALVLFLKRRRIKV